MIEKIKKSMFSLFRYIKENIFSFVALLLSAFAIILASVALIFVTDIKEHDRNHARETENHFQYSDDEETRTDDYYDDAKENNNDSYIVKSFTAKYTKFETDFKKASSDFIGNPTVENAKILSDLNNGKSALIKQAEQMQNGLVNGTEHISRNTMTSLKDTTYSISDTAKEQVSVMTKEETKYKKIIKDDVFNKIQKDTKDLSNQTISFLDSLFASVAKFGK